MDKAFKRSIPVMVYKLFPFLMINIFLLVQVLRESELFIITVIVINIISAIIFSLKLKNRKLVEVNDGKVSVFTVFKKSEFMFDQYERIVEGKLGASYFLLFNGDKIYLQLHDLDSFTKNELTSYFEK